MYVVLNRIPFLLDDDAEGEDERENTGVRPTLFDKQILIGGSRTSDEDPETQSESQCCHLLTTWKCS